MEATDKVSELIEQVKAKGMGVGVALKPGTPVEVRSLSWRWKQPECASSFCGVTGLLFVLARR